MSRIFLIFLSCFYLMGCNDKDASELDVDSELRLEVSINHFNSNGDFAKDYKTTSFTIRLFEDQFDKLKVLKANRHIKVKNKDEFIATIDGISYDLSEYYFSSSTLISDGKGEYIIGFDDHKTNFDELSISFTFDGGTYTADIELPDAISVVNHVDTLEAYDPLSDDMLIEWENVSLPAFLNTSRILFLTDTGSSCRSESLVQDLTEEDTALTLSGTDYAYDCYDGTQAINNVKTYVDIVQDHVDIENTSTGFQDVSSTYAQTDFWSKEDDL
jgi:hypothetical protein